MRVEPQSTNRPRTGARTPVRAARIRLRLAAVTGLSLSLSVLLGLVLAGCHSAEPTASKWTQLRHTPGAGKKGTPSKRADLNSPMATPKPPTPPRGGGTNANVLPPRYPSVRSVTRLHGRVITLNEPARFVVVDFGFGPAPHRDQRLAVYRRSERVGTVRVTGAPRSGLYAADILEGTPAVQDEVREE
jgi:hypothetical protein